MSQMECFSIAFLARPVVSRQTLAVALIRDIDVERHAGRLAVRHVVRHAMRHAEIQVALKCEAAMLSRDRHCPPRFWTRSSSVILDIVVV